MREGPRVIIACGGLEPELEALRPAAGGVEIEYLDQGLHRTPDRMPPILQKAVDEAARRASEIILAYGLCSNGVVGLKAPEQGLVVPRVHDCIALFLGSREAYARAFRERPGVYYLTPGWVAEKKDPLGYMEHDYVPRMGREVAEWGLREELKHYTHIVLINTPAADMAPLRERAMENARFLGKRYEEIRGSADYFRKILYGPYGGPEFVVVKAGGTVRQDPFLD